MNNLVVTERADVPVSAIPDEIAWQSLSPNTRRAYRHAHRKLDAWLRGRQLSDGLLAAYLGELDADGISPATISLAVSAVKWWFRMKKIPMPFDLTDLKLKTIRRDSQGRGRGQVAPLRHDEVERICWEARRDDNRIAGLRDIALVRTMRDGLLRISELVAVDVEHLQDKSLWIPRSKTDQEGEGAFLYLTQKTRKAIAQYREAAGIVSGALFVTVFKHSKRRLGKRLDIDMVRKIIKDRAKQAGITLRVSGHSFRVGSAVDLARGGASLVEMQREGRWKSPTMPAHYAGAVLAEQGAVARIFEED